MKDRLKSVILNLLKIGSVLHTATQLQLALAPSSVFSRTRGWLRWKALIFSYRFLMRKIGTYSDRNCHRARFLDEGQ